VNSSLADLEKQKIKRLKETYLKSLDDQVNGNQVYKNQNADMTSFERQYNSGLIHTIQKVKSSESLEF